ncbi:hypothetical protein [Pseudoalteromonas sp. T1lg10]|uniref:hypothetical protein n=1 Tax=Pseudoalteromonas sp. T1lg10 TaxID=2077093 RepID=UPI000CF71B30|nr:hypothetical protein [Pseudoalteromonas sp. T1lg10]
MSAFIISDEKTFLEYAHAVIAGQQDATDVKFENWPIISLNIKGKRYHSSLPTKLMEGLVCLQSEINKAYALISYRSANRQKLTNDDKEKLELTFTIKEGSTDTSGNLGDWVNAIINKLDVVLDDMTGKQKTGLIALLILAITGSYSVVEFNDSLQKTKIEIAKQEASKHQEEQRTEQIIALSETNKTAINALRQQVMEEAIEVSPKRAKQAVQIVNNGYREVVKSVQDADQMSIGDSTYSNAEIRKISEKPSVTRDVDEDSGDFHIDSIKRKETHLIVGVTMVGDDVSFNIKVDTSFLKPEESDSLYNAFRDGKPITLDYQANLQNGEILNARLIKVVLPSQTAAARKLQENTNEET